MRTWKDVATLVKTKNLKGRFVARGVTGLPFMLEEGIEVSFVPPRTDLPRSGTITFVQEIDPSSVEIEFDIVNGEEVGHEMVGMHCLMRRADLANYSNPHEPAAWDGWRIADSKRKDLALIVGLIENPGQSLLKVELVDSQKLAYIPVVDAFILEVDEEEGLIVVDLPDGLLEL